MIEDSEDKAYDEGQVAAYSGYRLRHNPYKRFTKEWEAWKQGWQDDRSDDRYWKEIDRQQRNYKANN